MPKTDSKSNIPQDYNFLLKELKRWLGLGIISKEQLVKIYSLYKKPQQTVEEKQFNIVPIISIFGSLMIGAGIILFFALNWSSIPKYVKVFSILAGLIASYHIGYMMKFQKASFPKVGSSLIFLGSIIFGSGIFLIGQIFNISAHWPNSFLFWFLGIVSLAYLAQSISIMHLSLILMGLYVGSESYYWFEFIDRYYHISYAYFLIFLSLGIVYYALGNLHGKNDKTKILRYPFHLIGSFFILFVTYLFSFKWFAREADYGYSANSANAGIQKISVLFTSRFWVIYLIVSALAAISLFINFQKREKSSRIEFYEIFYLGLLIVFTPIVVLFSKINFWFIPVVFNIILFLLIVGSVYLGYEKKQQTLVNLGIMAFGVAVISRYVEYLWDVLNGYLFFIIGGLLLIFLAIFLESNRKKIIKTI